MALPAPKIDGMTDEEPQDDAETTAASADEPDWALQTVVELINNMEDPATRASVTLVVDGGVVTGALVPAWRWFELQAESLRESAPNSGLGELFGNLAPHMRGEQVPNDLSPSFVHLVEAQYVDSNGLFPRSARLLWRGRLSCVSGWSFGTFGTTEPE